jgi:uncharacterized membrane protein (UPF0127 family)
MGTRPAVDILKRESGETLVKGARWCSSYLCKLRGLQFRRRLQPGEALVLVEKRDSVASSSIHMFFVFFPIAAVWVNREGKITHKALALPWRPFYASPEPARYVIEAGPELLDCVSVGEYLDFTSINRLQQFLDDT